MRKRIVGWIRQQVRQAGAKGIVLGLSGGIDSAVVAALCKEAVGAGKVACFWLPCYSQARDMKDAFRVARSLGLKIRPVNLSQVYDKLISILPEANALARANLKPRLRMMTLYYFANKYGYLVCGTGNKSEIMAGYFTKFGDGGVDILPIGGLLKTQVRQLAKETGIDYDIISKPPTAGLWPGQTDEGEMGITYNELDDILVRFEKAKRQILHKRKVLKVRSMMRRSEHKRMGPKVCCVS
jgi:NAD+ synthase